MRVGWRGVEGGGTWRAIVGDYFSHSPILPPKQRAQISDKLDLRRLLGNWKMSRFTGPDSKFNLMELLCQEESDSLIKTQLNVEAISSVNI